MTELIGDICKPSALVVPRAETTAEQGTISGLLVISGQVLFMNIDGVTWEAVGAQTA